MPRNSLVSRRSELAGYSLLYPRIRWQSKIAHQQRPLVSSALASPTLIISCRYKKKRERHGLPLALWNLPNGQLQLQVRSTCFSKSSCIANFTQVQGALRFQSDL